MADGEHQWIALLMFKLSNRQARAMREGPPGPPTFGVLTENPEVLPDGRANLRIQDIDQSHTTVGCYVCEQSWSDQVAASPCPGEPTAFDVLTGEPSYG